MKFGIAMTTRNRYKLLRKTLPQWVEQDLPIYLVTEPSQVMAHKKFVWELGLPKNVTVVSQGKANAGIGYARAACVDEAYERGYNSFIMADDDVYPREGDDVRDLLNFTAKKKSMGIAGWMSNYGLWVPDGNKIAKIRGCVIPFTGGPDRIFSLNVEMVLRAGNFHTGLDVRYENSEINRQGISHGWLWYVTSSVHIKMKNRPYDEGGLVALAGSVERRRAREKNCHRLIYERWGPDYISHPDKRYSCRWKKMLLNYCGTEATGEVYDRIVSQASDIVAGQRVVGRPRQSWTRGTRGSGVRMVDSL